MNKTTKIWLWVALVICVATTIMNAAMGRWPSVIIAVVAIAGLCILLFTGKKAGFLLMCVCYAVSCIVSIVGSIGGEGSLLVSVIMSIVGSLLIPGITALFLRGQWKNLK